MLTRGFDEAFALGLLVGVRRFAGWHAWDLLSRVKEREDSMAAAPERPVIRYPTDKEVREAFVAYVEAVGRVAHAWNYLMETMGRLFVIVSGIDRTIAAAIWYASDNDRVLLEIFKAITAKAPELGWEGKKDAKADVLWLAERVSNLHDKRNNAVHAPCSLLVEPDGPTMVPQLFSDHRRAKNLRGTELLVEFDWCERWANALTTFARAAEQALLYGDCPWPEKPDKPDRMQKKALLAQRRRLRIELHPPQPQSSQE